MIIDNYYERGFVNEGQVIQLLPSSLNGSVLFLVIYLNKFDLGADYFVQKP